MRIYWRRLAKRTQNMDLARRIVDVIVAANDMRNPHIHIVPHGAKIVRGRSVRAGNHQIVQHPVWKLDGAFNGVLPADMPLLGIPETDDGFDADWGRRQFFAGFWPPAPIVAGGKPL